MCEWETGRICNVSKSKTNPRRFSVYWKQIAYTIAVQNKFMIQNWFIKKLKYKCR